MTSVCVLSECKAWSGVLGEMDSDSQPRAKVSRVPNSGADGLHRLRTSPLAWTAPISEKLEVLISRCLVANHRREIKKKKMGSSKVLGRRIGMLRGELRVEFY